MAHYDYDTCTEGDCPLCLAIGTSASQGGDSLVVQLGFMVVDAVSKLNEKIDNLPAPTATVDLTDIKNEIAQDRQTLDDKFDTFTTALNAKFASLPAGSTPFDPTNLEDTFNAKLDSLVLAIDAKIAAIPAPDISAYSTAEDSQAYADDTARETLTDANAYADAADEVLADSIAKVREDLTNLVVLHAIPAAAVAAQGAFDPTMLDPLKDNITALQKFSAAQTAINAKIPVIVTLTKAAYDALATKDPATIYVVKP